MKYLCDEINELLVDYADGELSGIDAKMIQEHIAECKQCQDTLDALKKSIGIAKVIWEDGLDEIASVKIPVYRPVRHYWIKITSAAAGILIAVGWLMWISYTKPKERDTTWVMAEIEQCIANEGNAARLLATAELLTDYPDCQSLIKQQYSYIIETYPETKSATYAKIKITNFERRM